MRIIKEQIEYQNLNQIELQIKIKAHVYHQVDRICQQITDETRHLIYQIWRSNDK